MRRFDKTKNILKANILAEQRYLESKGLIKEVTDNYDNTADRAAQSGINQYGDEDKVETNFEYYLDDLDIDFDIKNRKVIAKVLDVKIPNGNELVPVTYVFDIVYERDSIGADADEDPIMGDTPSEIDLEFNEGESILNNEARNFIYKVNEKIVDDKDRYFELKRSLYERHESLDEGAKEWVVGGLLALSSIAGFYKLSDNAKRDERAKMEYVTKLNSVVDNLDSTKTIDLARQYDLTDFGTGSNSSGHIEPETSYRDDNGEMVYTNPNVESVKDNIKQEIKNHPENFQISKDGRTIKPMRQ
jgi:hypothetical protein